MCIRDRDYAGLTGEETVLDLYCGAGTITLALAEHAKTAIGVEIVPEAIENAKRCLLYTSHASRETRPFCSSQRARTSRTSCTATALARMTMWSSRFRWRYYMPKRRR